MHKIQTFVLAKPGLIRNALQAFLQAEPEIDLLYCDHQPDVLYQKIAQGKHGTVVIDLNGDKQILEEVIKQVKTINPNMVCVVITDKVNMQKLTKQWGADQVLQHGMLDEHLRNALQQSID